MKNLIKKFSYFNLHRVLKYDKNGYAEIYRYNGNRYKYPLLFLTLLGMGGLNV